MLARSRFRSLALLAPIMLTLAGCSSSSDVSGYVARSEPQAPMTLPVNSTSASSKHSAEMIAAMPGAAGVVRSVREKFYGNGFSQYATLAGDGAGFGENRLEISVLTGESDDGGRGLALGPPSEEGIRREILKRYPRLGMRIVTEPRRNAYGVFGLAIGRASNGARCIFSWQWVEDISGAKAGTPGSIRVHLCRKDSSVDDLAAAVEGLGPTSLAAFQRAFDASRSSRATVAVGGGGRTVAISGARGGGQLEAALGAAESSTRVAARRDDGATPRRHVRPTRYAGRHRARYAARRHDPNLDAGVTPAAQQIQPQATPAFQPAYASGPRYLAPMGGQPAYGAGGPPPGYTPRQLDASLPAAAYRGPSSR